MTLSHERPQRTLSKESDMKLQELFNWTRSYMNPIIVLLFRYFQLWKTCLLAICHLLWAPLHFGGRAAMTDWITPRKCLSSLCHLKNVYPHFARWKRWEKLVFPVSATLNNISCAFGKNLYQSQIGFPQRWNKFWDRESDNTIS